MASRGQQIEGGAIIMTHCGAGARANDAFGVSMRDFFISYTGSDEKWAEWIAWTLEAGGFAVVLQKWDFRPGSNFALNMHDATGSKRTIAVLSQEYLTQSFYGAAEWAAAFAKDPDGSRQTLVPIRVAECKPEGLLRAIVYIDLVGKDAEEARRALLDGVAERRAKPSSEPHFPGKKAQSVAPVFPGSRVGAALRQQFVERHMPKIQRMPSDLEKRQFVKSAFKIIQEGFDSRLVQFAVKNPSVETDLTPDGTAFTAEIFLNGKSRAQCKIWQGGFYGTDGISYAEGSTMRSPTACNEILTIANGDGLALSATMNMGVGGADEELDVKNLTPEDAAEYLWRRFTWAL
jgi:hypothetical protein